MVKLGVRRIAQLYYRRQSTVPAHGYYGGQPIKQPHRLLFVAKRKHKSATARKRLGKVFRKQLKANKISRRFNARKCR